MQQKRVLVLLNFSYYQFTLSSSETSMKYICNLYAIHMQF